MNKNILKTGPQSFIKNNYNTDIVSVLLRKQQFDGVSQKELAEQLEAIKKCKDKLPKWFSTSLIYYPNKLNIEQTSSEKTACYKSNLVSGKTLLDVTGGLGVDSYYFSKKVEETVHCELNSKLSQIAAHNFDRLGVKNISCLSKNGIDFLVHGARIFDWVFIDPSRRNNKKGRVFLLKDCLPDVPSNLNQIFEKTKNILIKTSPLLDISQGISELKFVKEIHVVAVNNEVKELLWILEKDYSKEALVKTINLKRTGGEVFDFKKTEEENSDVVLGIPEIFLYQPNAAILKAGAFKTVANRLGLKKLHEHSHLYTCEQLRAFPGRSFKIKKVVPYSKKEVKSLALTKANIATRNFPLAVSQIRNKHKINDGGEHYLFFTKTVKNENVVILCSKV